MDTSSASETQDAPMDQDGSAPASPKVAPLRLKVTQVASISNTDEGFSPVVSKKHQKRLSKAIRAAREAAASAPPGLPADQAVAGPSGVSAPAPDAIPMPRYGIVNLDQVPSSGGYFNFCCLLSFVCYLSTFTFVMFFLLSSWFLGSGCHPAPDQVCACGPGW